MPATYDINTSWMQDTLLRANQDAVEDLEDYEDWLQQDEKRSKFKPWKNAVAMRLKSLQTEKALRNANLDLPMHKIPIGDLEACRKMAREREQVLQEMAEAARIDMEKRNQIKFLAEERVARAFSIPEGFVHIGDANISRLPEAQPILNPKDAKDLFDAFPSVAVRGGVQYLPPSTSITYANAEAEAEMQRHYTQGADAGRAELEGDDPGTT
jgi:hypothetical protein